MLGIPELDKMTDKDITDMCDVIKRLGWPSIFKLLRESTRDRDRRYYTRKELNEIAGLTNVNNDKAFLVQHRILIEERIDNYKNKLYRFAEPYRIESIAEFSRKIIFEFRDTPFYRY